MKSDWEMKQFRHFLVVGGGGGSIGGAPTDFRVTPQKQKERETKYRQVERRRSGQITVAI
jgi:hypothetical protein